MVLEDNRDNLLEITAVLDKGGFKYIKATDGHNALVRAVFRLGRHPAGNIGELRSWGCWITEDLTIYPGREIGRLKGSFSIGVR